MKYLVIIEDGNRPAYCIMSTSNSEVAKAFAGRNSKIQRMGGNPWKYYINESTNVQADLAKLGQDSVAEINLPEDLFAKINVGIDVTPSLAVKSSPLELLVEQHPKEAGVEVSVAEHGIGVRAVVAYKSDVYIHIESAIKEAVTTAEEYIDAGFEIEETLQAMKEVLEA